MTAAAPSNFDRFHDALRESAYGGLDVSDHTIDSHGWMDTCLLDVVKSALVSRSDDGRQVVVVEVGSWKGLSTSAIAMLCKQLGHGGARMVAVDTWLGAPEFWTWGFEDPSRGGSLNRVHGYPSVFYTFTKNIKAMGHDDVVAPLPISSVQGADVLGSYGCAADVIYIDASHEHAAVLADLAAYWPLLKPGGTMVGDDYTACWSGVISAVNEFAHRHSLEVSVAGSVWSIRKRAA